MARDGCEPAWPCSGDGQTWAVTQRSLPGDSPRVWPGGCSWREPHTRATKALNHQETTCRTVTLPEIKCRMVATARAGEWRGCRPSARDPWSPCRVAPEGHSPATQSCPWPDSCHVHLCTRTSHDSYLRDVCVDRAPAVCQAYVEAAERPRSLVVKTTGPRAGMPGFESRLFFCQLGDP